MPVLWSIRVDCYVSAGDHFSRGSPSTAEINIPRRLPLIYSNNSGRVNFRIYVEFCRRGPDLNVQCSVASREGCPGNQFNKADARLIKALSIL